MSNFIAAICWASIFSNSGFDGGIVRVLQIERMHQAAAKHERPQAIGDVSVERVVGAVGRQLRELLAITELGDRFHVVARRDLIFVARQIERLVDHHAIGHPRSRPPRHVEKHRLKRDVAAGVLGLEYRLLVAFLARDRVRRLQEREQALVIGLQIVIHDRVIVALGALHVAAEKDAADVAGEHVGVGATIQGEAGRCSRRRIGAVGQQNFLGQHVPRLVLADRFQQPGLPFVGRYVGVRAALHQHQIERLGEMADVMRRSKQPIDELLAFIGSALGEENAGFVRRGRHADQIERCPTEEFGIRERRPARRQ